MKILAICDVHNEVKKARKLRYIIDERKPDVIVVAGDLTSFGPASAASDILDTLTCGKKDRPVFAVAGNGDNYEVRNMLEKRGVNLHNKSATVDRVGFVGFSGPSSLQLGGLMVLNYDPVGEKLKDIDSCDKKVIISHIPPSNTKVDTLFTGHHVGSDFLRDMIEEKQPDVVICGHIHEARGVDRIGKTIIVNPGAVCESYAAMIEIDSAVDGREPKVEFLTLK